jgi:two-component sensor histidine kinase
MNITTHPYSKGGPQMVVHYMTNGVVGSPHILNGLDPWDKARHKAANTLSVVLGLVRLRGEALKNQKGKISVYQISKLLDDIDSRILTLGLLNRLLLSGPELASFNLADCLDEICRIFVPSRNPELTLSSAEECMISFDYIVPVSLIVAEVTSNAVRHAHPTGIAGKLLVRCYKEDNLVKIEVADDGVGLPEEFDWKVDGGVGFCIIRALARQIQAHVRFSSSPLGLRFFMELSTLRKKKLVSQDQNERLKPSNLDPSE